MRLFLIILFLFVGVALGFIGSAYAGGLIETSNQWMDGVMYCAAIVSLGLAALIALGSDY